MAQQIQIRRDTSTNWTSVNPILAQGEFGYETDTSKLKIGDGTTAWNSLAYFAGGGSGVNSLVSLTDVSITSLVSGQVILSNGSLQFINLSLSSLVNELVSFSSLGSLAFQNTVDYSQITGTPSLGSLAVLNDLSYTSLLNLPSLGSLAVLNSLTAADVGLGNVTNDAQLKIASNLSDLNNVETARGNLSLGSLAVMNTAAAQLPSTASLDILYSNGIVNYSTISTNILRTRGLFVASTASIRVLRGTSATWTSSIGAANLSGTNTGDQDMPFYGDGSDGTVYLDGLGSTNSLPYVTYDSSTQTYTQTRDIYATDFFLDSGFTLKTSGYRIFATVEFINNGTISNNGNPATGATAGTGAPGGFFRAGGTGGAGRLAAAAAGAGAFPPLPTLNTYIGNVPGRGAGGRSALNAQAGNNVALASLTSPVLGGKQLIGNFFTYQNPIIHPTVTTVAQPTYSLGGGGGAKSTTGTGAVSGGGGGGGGVVFIASPQITSFLGTIEARGGAGGDATGTGGIFGGGGGGGGGYVFLHTSTNWGFGSISPPDVSGGAGGLSAGNANTLSIGRTDSTIFSSTATVQYLTMRPLQALDKGSYYLLAVHVSYDAGSVLGVNAGDIGGMGMVFNEVAQVAFNTIADPTRSLFLFRGYVDDHSVDQLQDRIFINFTQPVNSCRVIFDEIQNTSEHESVDPFVGFTTNSGDTGTSAITNLGYTPTTGNTQYTVVATNVGSAFTGGTGVTLLANQATDPRLASGIAVSRASSNITWTTSSAYGVITVDLDQPSEQESGRPGAEGRVLYFTS